MLLVERDTTWQTVGGREERQREVCQQFNVWKKGDQRTVMRRPAVREIEIREQSKVHTDV